MVQREQTILHQKMLAENHNDEKQAIGGWDDCFSFLAGRQNITNIKKIAREQHGILTRQR